MVGNVSNGLVPFDPVLDDLVLFYLSLGSYSKIFKKEEISRIWILLSTVVFEVSKREWEINKPLIFRSSYPPASAIIQIYRHCGSTVITPSPHPKP